MDRRHFTLATTGTLVALGLAACKPKEAAAPAATNNAPTPAPAATTVSVPPAIDATTLKAGKDYIEVNPAVADNTPQGKASVVEFFGYWCPHCNVFEPEFAAWAKAAPTSVNVVRVPVAFRPEMVPLQRMYYALEALDKVEAVHAKVFHALHVEKQQLYSDDAVLAWAAKQPELGGDAFVQAYKGFGINAKIAQADAMAKGYQISGVPCLGVAGKYLVSGEQAGSGARMLQIAQALAVQAAKG